MAEHYCKEHQTGWFKKGKEGRLVSEPLPTFIPRLKVMRRRE